jgi:hypothetical protein
MANKIQAPIDMVIRAKKMFEKAETKGWKRHGNFTKKDGSSYQCFRRGNKYLWIGFRFIQRDQKPHVVDYVRDGEDKILAILS